MVLHFFFKIELWCTNMTYFKLNYYRNTPSIIWSSLKRWKRWAPRELRYFFGRESQYPFSCNINVSALHLHLAFVLNFTGLQGYQRISNRLKTSSIIKILRKKFTIEETNDKNLFDALLDVG